MHSYPTFPLVRARESIRRSLRDALLFMFAATLLFGLYDLANHPSAHVSVLWWFLAFVMAAPFGLLAYFAMRILRFAFRRS